MKKKFSKLALILAICMLATLTPISVFADNNLVDIPNQDEIVELPVDEKDNLILIGDEQTIADDVLVDIGDMIIKDSAVELVTENPDMQEDTADIPDQDATDNLSETESDEVYFYVSSNYYDGTTWVAYIYLEGYYKGDTPCPSSLSISVPDDAKAALIEAALSQVRGDREVEKTLMLDIEMFDEDENPISADNLVGDVWIEFETFVDCYNVDFDAYVADGDGAVKIEKEYEYFSSSYSEIEGTAPYKKTMVFETYAREFNIFMTENTSIRFDDLLFQAGVRGYAGDMTDISFSNAALFEIQGEDENRVLVNKGRSDSKEWMKFNLGGKEITVNISVAPEYKNHLVDDPDAPQFESSLFMRYYTSDDGIDVQGLKQGTPIQTTYSDDGYETSLAVNGQGGSWCLNQIGKVYTLSGIQIKINSSIIDDGETVKFVYSVFNATNDTATVSFGPNSDSMIGDNDDCAVTLSEGGQRITMTDDHTGDCNSKGMTYNLTSDPATPFAGAWIGNYYDRYDHLFDCQADGMVVGEDSGLTAHWDVTLDPGTKATRTCYFSIVPSLVVKNPQLKADAETKTVIFDVPFTDAENRTVTLYYTLEGLEEQTATAVTGEGETEGKFHFGADASSWTANTTRRVDLYAVDNVGYESKHYTFEVWWPEFNPGKTYYELSFANSNNRFATIRDEAGKKVILPSDSSTEKSFLGWNTKEDGTGTLYLGGTEYTLTSENVTLYAQWKIPADNLTIFAENQKYTGQEIKTVSVSQGSKPLTAGKDYLIEYKDNINAGTASARIYGGMVEGEKTVNFEITKANLTNISVTAAQVKYNGKPQRAVVTTTGNTVDSSLVSFKYYLKGQEVSQATAEVPEVTEPGEHTAFYIASAPNHKEVLGTFDIVVKADLSSGVVVVEDGEIPYTGKPQREKLVIKVGDKELVEGVDFEVVEGDREGTEIGDYELVIRGLGDYEGTLTITWSIVPQKNAPLPEGDPQTNKNNNDVLNETWGLIQTSLSAGGVLPDYVTEMSEGAIEELIKSGDGAAVRVILKDITKEVSDKEKELVEAEVKKITDKTSIDGYVDVKVVILNAKTEEIVGYISKTDKPLNLTAVLDSETGAKLKDKIIKTVRIHDGKAETFEAALTENNVAFSSDKFSTFGIISTEKPQVVTGDSSNAALYIILIIVALFAGAVALFVRKRAVR